jgi:hypothetical protein
MKAKDLIKMLQGVHPEAEIVTPGFDETGAASDFSLELCYVKWDANDPGPGCAPHEYYKEICEMPDIGDSGFHINAYLLDGKW